MSKNVFNFENDGHTYKVVPVEGSDSKYSVIRDGVTTRQTTRDKLFVGDDVNYDCIIKLF